jgi:hypothetical protein
MFDLKIIVLATTPEALGLTAFGILALVYPLTWPGTFIPILPKKLITVLEMPFGSIIGVHSTLSRKLIDENFGAYFVINADSHDASSVGTDDFPPQMISHADEVAEEIKDLIGTFRPVFPAAEVHRRIKEFILRVLGAVYEVDPKSPAQLYAVFRKMRESPPDGIAAQISQTQFVDTLFREALEERNQEVMDSPIRTGSTFRQPGRCLQRQEPGSRIRRPQRRHTRCACPHPMRTTEGRSRSARRAMHCHPIRTFSQESTHKRVHGIAGAFGGA